MSENVRTNEDHSPNNLIDITTLFYKYMRALRNNLLLMIILAAIGTALNAIITYYTYQPKFVASETYSVNMSESLNSSYSAMYDNYTASQMATTFDTLLQSDLMQKRVSEKMNDVGMTPADIMASVEPNTNLLTISATSNNPEAAYSTLETVISNYMELSNVIVGKSHMDLIDDSGMPVDPVNPYVVWKECLKGAVYGILLCMLLVGVRTLTRRTVDEQKDFKRFLHMRSLGSFPKVVHSVRQQRQTNSILVTNPKYEDVLQEPLRMIRNKLEYQASQTQAKTLMFTSALAGEGKSTLAVNMAISLAQAGKKIVLIDCDLRNPSDADIFGLQCDIGLREVLEGTARLEDVIYSRADLGLPDDVALNFIPGGKRMEDGSGILSQDDVAKIIKLVSQWADYVILDCAPAGLLTDAVILAKHADGVIFVVRKDLAKVDFIMESLENLASSHIPVLGGILNGA